METVTNWIAWCGIAAGGATWMWPDFYQWALSASNGAALLMPVMGCVWLGVQIWVKVSKGV